MKKIIQIQPNEELISIIDKIIKSQAQEIFLVVPSENKILISSGNLKLLKRESEAIRKKIIIVSSDPKYKKLAKKLKIEAKTKVPILKEEELIQEVETLPRQIKKVLDIIPRTKKERAILKEPKLSIFSKKKKKVEVSLSKSKDKSWLSISSSNWLYILLGVFIIIVGILSFLFLPKVEIKIIPKIEKLEFSLDLKVKEEASQVDFTNSEVPGQYFLVEREKSKEFLTTGEEERESKAKGLVSLYNAYSSQSQTLVANTRFISSSGKLFRIPKSVVIPGATVKESKIIPNSTEVEVVADQPGEEYNIGPTTFSIPGFKGTPKYTGFYAKSFQAMEGGYLGEVKIVIEEDLEAAKDSLSSELFQDLETELKSKIPSDLKLIEGVLSGKVSQVFFNKKEGDVGESFTLKIKGLIRVLVFKEEDVKKIVESSVNLKITDNKISLPSTLHLNYSLDKIDFDEKTMDLRLIVEEKIAWQINSEEIKKNIITKNEEGIRIYFSSYPGIEKAEVKLWPFWVKKAPNNKNKIKVKVVYPGG